jgi:quinol monooxygenase YgiN
MIRHIVFFTVRDPARLAQVETDLKALEATPHAHRLLIRRNLKRDALANDVDLVVYGEFADEDALARYKAEPAYAEAVRKVRPHRELRLAADIAET